MPHDGNIKELRLAVLWDEARDATIIYSRRARAHHDLVEEAVGRNDDALWLEIGLHLIRARERNELDYNVCKSFVRSCPEDVFAALAQNSTPVPMFPQWSVRAKHCQRTSESGSDLGRDSHFKKRRRRQKGRYRGRRHYR